MAKQVAGPTRLEPATSGMTGLFILHTGANALSGDATQAA